MPTSVFLKPERPQWVDGSPERLLLTDAPRMHRRLSRIFVIVPTHRKADALLQILHAFAVHPVKLLRFRRTIVRILRRNADDADSRIGIDDQIEEVRNRPRRQLLGG